jgi:nitroreductase
MTPDDVNKLLQNRRSVFQQTYTGEHVKDEIVRQMLINASWAPTHRLTQPWHFIVFTRGGLKKFAEGQAEIYKEVTLRDGSFREDRYQNLLTKPMQSSHIIAVCMKRDPKRSVPEIEEVGAVFCAVENIYVTATAYGVGCYLSTGGITYFEESKKLFDLENEDRLLGFIHVGMPKEIPAKGKRKPPEEFSVWFEN